MLTCPANYFGESTLRTCVTLCDVNTYSYAPASDTTIRICRSSCPDTYFADDTANVRKCWPASSSCTYGFGDPYLNECVNVCSGPSTTPVDSFGSGDDCVTFCPDGTYADSHTGTRLCVALCPPGTTGTVAAPNLYGDPTTRTCEARCITPETWADYQTRIC